MSSPSDPIRFWRRRLLAIWLTGSAAVIAAGTWSWHNPDARTIGLPPIDLRPADSPVSGHEAQVPPLDLDLFAVNLVNTPPPPESTAPAQAETRIAVAPPPRLQLIGITREGEVYLAAVYDIEADRLHIVRDGDRLGPIVITRVSAGDIRLEVAGREHRLALDDEAGDGARGRS